MWRVIRLANRATGGDIHHDRLANYPLRIENEPFPRCRQITVRNDSPGRPINLTGDGWKEALNETRHHAQTTQHSGDPHCRS